MSFWRICHLSSSYQKGNINIKHIKLYVIVGSMTLISLEISNQHNNLCTGNKFSMQISSLKYILLYFLWNAIFHVRTNEMYPWYPKRLYNRFIITIRPWRQNEIISVCSDIHSSKFTEKCSVIIIVVWRASGISDNFLKCPMQYVNEIFISRPVSGVMTLEMKGAGKFSARGFFCRRQRMKSMTYQMK